MQFTPQTPSTKLAFPLNSLKHIHLNDSSPRMSSLSSLHWVPLLRFPRSFWGSCHNWATCFDPTFLGYHDPKCREVATCNIGSVWGCCHLSFFSPPTWPVTLFLIALPSCCLHFYLFKIKYSELHSTFLTLLSHPFPLSIKFNIMSGNKIKIR